MSQKVNLSKLGFDIAENSSSSFVSNLFPQTCARPRIAVITDYPYKSNSQMPLEASHFGLMASLFKSAGLNLNTCFHGVVINHFIKSYSISRFDWSNDRVQTSVTTLEKELAYFEPDFIIGLGEFSLHFLKENPGAFDDERGAPFIYKPLNCLALVTYHPRQIFVQYKLNVLASADLSKAARYIKEGLNLEEVISTQQLEYRADFSRALELLDLFERTKPYLSVDIETTMTNHRMTCIGLAWSKKQALTIPFYCQGKPSFSIDQEATLLRKLAVVLRVCPLVGQNAVHFDHLILAQRYGILANFIDDTMLAHWECYKEMPKSLGFMNSLYTDNPYWKADLKAARSGKIDPHMEFKYNARDCIYTYEIIQSVAKEFKELPASARDHYKFNIATSRVYQYATMRGVYFDTNLRDERVKKLSDEAGQLQSELLGEVGHTLNVNSPAQMKRFLYEELGLPVKYKLTKNTKTGEKSEVETADYLNMLYLQRQFPDIKALKIATKLRKLKKRESFLNSIVPDSKGKVYWGFNIVGAETGRSTGYKPINGHGVQPQNVSREDRDLFLPGPNMYWLKADLEGADSWTQAAQLKALGHSILMEDLLGGLKPAQAIAIALMAGTELLSASRNEILSHKHLLSTEEGKTTYRICKAISHGSAYMMKKQMMHMNIFRQSNGEMWVEPNTCERYQKLLFARYPFPRLHEFVRGKLNQDARLVTADGGVREFYGRKDDATLREMLSHPPQAHTAYVTNLMMHRIFYDQTNNPPVLEIVNQVHDELDAVFPVERIEFVRDLFCKHKDITLEFWGEKFQIPFEAGFGTSWGNATENLINA